MITVLIEPFTYVLSFCFPVPSSPPVNVSLADVTSTSLTIKWNPPPDDEHNGIIQYYLLSVEEIPSNITLSLNTSELSISLTNLHPDYEYEFIISAVTVGPGPFFSSSFKLPEDGQ